MSTSLLFRVEKSLKQCQPILSIQRSDTIFYVQYLQIESFVHLLSIYVPRTDFSKLIDKLTNGANNNLSFRFQVKTDVG